MKEKEDDLGLAGQQASLSREEGYEVLRGKLFVAVVLALRKQGIIL